MSVSLDKLRVASLLATTASSYFYFGNLGAANFGIVPATRDPLSKNTFTAVERAKLWAWFYDRAKIALAGSALSFIMIPFTAALMLPVNNTLGEIAKTDTLIKVDDEKVTAKVDKNLDAWRALHIARMTFGFGAWVSSIVLFGLVARD